MFNRRLGILISLFTFLFFSCSLLSPTLKVEISEITCEKSTITVADTVKFECIASSSGKLHYHWSFQKGSTVYTSSIIEKANTSDSFDHGEWVTWNPPSSGTWTIEVLAYLKSGDHSSRGTGNWDTYYEYDEHGIPKEHCFSHAEKGKRWDKTSITKTVSD